MLIAVIGICMLSCIVNAAPYPHPRAHPQTFEVFQTGSLYPTFFVNHVPLSYHAFPNSFYQLTDYPLSLNGYPISKSNDTKNGTEEAKLRNLPEAKFEGIDTVVVDAATNGKADKAHKFENALNLKTHVFGLEGLKNGKNDCVETSGKIHSAIHSISGSGLDPIFGPEIAPHYEIHYTPGENYNFDLFPFNFDYSSLNKLGTPLAFENKNETATENGKANNGSQESYNINPTSTSEKSLPEESNSESIGENFNSSSTER